MKSLLRLMTSISTMMRLASKEEHQQVMQPRQTSNMLAGPRFILETTKMNLMGDMLLLHSET